MPRYAMVDKTVQGQPVSHTEFLNAVVQAIDRVEGGARVAELVNALGPEWDPQDQRKFLATTLDNLTRRHVLRRAEGKRGLYEVTPHYKRAGVSVFDAEEKAILDVIRTHGGFCRFRDIMEAFGCRVAGPDGDLTANSGIHSRLMYVIRKSKLIRQDLLESGIYNLPWADLAGQPMRGKWAALITKKTYYEQCYTTKAEIDDNVWRTWRDTLFYNVGAAFKDLRKTHGLSITDLLDDRRVRAAVAEFVRAAPGEIAIIRQDWFDRTGLEVDRMREEGATSNAVDDYREQRDSELGLRQPEWLYGRFEKGKLGAHMMAPLGFYQAVAERFDLCPAQLSRGLIALLPPDDVRLRPTRERRSPDEMFDEQLEIEAMDAARLKMIYGVEEEDDMVPSA